MIFAVGFTGDIEEDLPSMSLTDAEETTLVGLVREGRREAFDEIDRRYRRKLCKFLARHTSGSAHAEELAQRALVKAFMSIDSLRRHDRLGGWLYKIAFRLAVDEARKGEGPVLLDVRQSEEIIDHRSATDETSPIETDNLWATARKVLNASEYSAVWLKYVDGYKIDSIAKIMGRTKISVRVLLFRARKKLLPALAKSSDEEE